MTALLALAVLSAAVPACVAWGAAGHQVSAALAERHVTAEAGAGLLADLGTFSFLYPSESVLITSATWADTIKSSNAGALASSTLLRLAECRLQPSTSGTTPTLQCKSAEVASCQSTARRLRRTWSGQ